MKLILAKIISLVLHPLIIPSAGLLLLFNSGTYLEFLSYQQQRAVFIILFTGTAILPISIIPLMMLHRMVTSLEMEEHNERVFPLLVTTIFYGFTWYMLKRLDVPGLISIYSITAAFMVLICAMISIKWKISLHMSALGALAGTMLAIAFRFNINLQLFLSLVILSGGLAGWARLRLNAHTPAQVYAGYLGGLALAFFMIYNF